MVEYLRLGTMIMADFIYLLSERVWICDICLLSELYSLKSLSLRLKNSVFVTMIVDVEFLRKAWNSKGRPNNFKGLQKYFREGKEPSFFGDSLKQEDTVSFIYEHFLDVPGDS